MRGIKFRLNEFIRPADQHSLIVDASAGMILGALPGLEDFTAGIKPVLPLIDGLVCSPGQLHRLGGSTMQEAGLLVRIDWTNTLRDHDFVMPPERNFQFPLFSARDALDFGAAGMVLSFLLGYEEEIEAACMKALVTLAIEGKEAGLPVVVEVRPSGPRVSLPAKAVELGASYALEGGADVIVIPNPGLSSLKTISAMVSSIPWLLKPGNLFDAEQELVQALSLGGAGLWLDHTLFSQPSPTRIIDGLYSQLHSTQPAAQSTQ
jgi:DhnA family fructose-bisphosphate aldolase class Ia